MISKDNVPYYIAGTLATFTLLASGVFAAAPYIGFLAPVAALSVGLPFIIGYAVFSVVTIALSYKAISKNKTISEKEAQLADEKSKVEAKGKIISEKEAVVQDQKQTISELEAKIQAQEQTRLDYLNLEVLSSEQKQRANSLDYLSIDNVPKQPDHLNVDAAAKSYLMSLSEDQDVFYDAESGDEKDTEISSLENEPAKEENGQSWSAWSLDKAKTAAKLVVGGAMVAAAAAPMYPFSGVAE
ncbi:MAG: hypothetical protein ACR5K5_03350 [Wolbachia sp.]